MPFQFTCPYCHISTLVDDKYAGHSGPCAGCGKEITIPTNLAKRNASARVADERERTRLRSNIQRAKSGLFVLRIGIGAAVVTALAALAFFAIYPVLQTALANRTQNLCLTNMLKIVEALNAYEQLHGSYPTPIVTDAAGKPLYSWRVLILPQLGYDGLYESFQKDEPWDSIMNTQLHSSMPEVYASPGSTDARSLGETNYSLLVGRGTLFQNNKPLPKESMLDDPSQTILLCETDNGGVCWVAPGDIDVTNGARLGSRPMQDIGGNHAGSANVVTVDGTPMKIPNNASPEVIDALVSPNGGEQIETSAIVAN